MVAKLEELEHSVVIAVDLYVVDLETVDLSPNHIKVKKVRVGLQVIWYIQFKIPPNLFYPFHPANGVGHATTSTS